MTLQKTKIAIIGAGPAGTALSLFLCKKKIHHYLIEKSTFPRDKVCGDGLTSEVLKVLNLLNPKWLEEFLSLDFVSAVDHVLFENATGDEVIFDYHDSSARYKPFYIARRENFDAWLFSKVNHKYANVKVGFGVNHVYRKEKKVHIELDNLETIITDLVIGADGERSIVRKSFHQKGLRKEKAHSSGGLRQYYRNVSSPFLAPSLEIYQLKNRKIGYLWMFYLPNNEVNVGIGALGKQPKGVKINLKEELISFIETHHQLKERFKNAEPIEHPKGWGLPFNSNASNYAGQNFALIGDAAHMIEPLTGKGIGVAMFASKYLADTIEKAISENDFSAEMMEEYIVLIERKFRKEWKWYFRLQRLSRFKFLGSLFLMFINIPLFKKNFQRRYIQQIESFVERV
jgi:geranylgeranyl reductase family protein